MQTLIVGLGRAGRELHLSVIQRARNQDAFKDLFDDTPVVGVDPAQRARLPDVLLAGSLSRARELSPPDRSVVHLCTPLQGRLELLEAVVGLGYRRMIVEKPLAADEADLTRVTTVCQSSNLDLAVVAPWLASALTQRLVGIVADGGLGELRSISIVQRKPRFTRSYAAMGCSSAFDVELPHSVGVALMLAGPAQVRSAGCADMRVDDLVIPRMGGAWLTLDHDSGVRSEIFSDLTSPKRERAITLELGHATVKGYYACSDADNTAQLNISVGGHVSREIFVDDSLTEFMVRSYRHFVAPHQDDGGNLVLSAQVVRLLSRAKDLVSRPEPYRLTGLLAPDREPLGQRVC